MHLASFRVRCAAFKDGVKLSNNFSEIVYARIVPDQLQMFSNNTEKVFNCIDIEDVQIYTSSEAEFLLPVKTALALCKSPINTEARVDIFVDDVETIIRLTYRGKTPTHTSPPGIEYMAGDFYDLDEFMEEESENSFIEFPEEDNNLEITQDTLVVKRTISAHDVDVFDIDAYSRDALFSFETSLEVVKDMVGKTGKEPDGVITLRVVYNRATGWYVLFEYSKPIDEVDCTSMVKGRNLSFAGGSPQPFKANIKREHFVKLNTLDVREPQIKKSKVFGNLFFFVHSSEINGLHLCVKSVHSTFRDKFLFACPLQRCTVTDALM